MCVLTYIVTLFPFRVKFLKEDCGGYSKIPFYDEGVHFNQKGEFSMTTTVQVSNLVKIVEGGVTTVEREFSSTQEVTGKAEASFWLDTTDTTVTVCVKETVLTTLTNPMVVGLSDIRGLSVNSDVNLTVKLNGAATGFEVAAGPFQIAWGSFSTIVLERNDTKSGNVTIIVWGDR